MNFEVGQSTHGFKLIRKENIAEINSLSLIFEHEKNGAEVIFLENDDDNKVFSITFRTPPGNDRGVAHILEHSVLCGSKNYPVKEPFVELMKSSLQTFLNAMTFPDKTMYPVASRNAQDLSNLMSVYLDAVLYPKITEETFKQEGWHYELESSEADLVYKGVVFNEMKGVFSSPESVLDRDLSHSLFPDTTYGCESGGDPEAIPDLTYEEFKTFHQKHYHPSNSRIFIYGDGDTEEYLKFLNDKYLKDFERAEVASSISMQKNFDEARRKVAQYPVGKDETIEKKTFVAVGFKMGNSSDHEHCLSMNILSHILIGTQASPLRKALIDSGLGNEVIGGGFDDNRAETSFTVGLNGTEKENEETIVDLIFITLKDLAENGIDENTVTASVNTTDFKLREANFGGFPKGIVYNIQALASWLYDNDPLMHLKYDEVMQKIKEESRNSYFEKLIKKYFLDHNHRSVIVLAPQQGLGEELESITQEKLKEFKSTLDQKKVDELIEETRILKEMQMKPDDPEALATLPCLKLKDVSGTIPIFPLEIKSESSPIILFHDLFTNKIAYTQLAFNANAIPQDMIQYLPLFGKLILGMGTKKNDYVQMAQQIGIRTGGISGSHYSVVARNAPEDILSYIMFRGVALTEKLEDLYGLYAELFGEYSFDNHQRLSDIIKASKADMEASIVPHGNNYVSSRLGSYHSKMGKYDEITGGITYYKFMEELQQRVEKDPAEVADKFDQVAKVLFTRDNLMANITSEQSDYPQFEKRTNELANIFPKSLANPIQLEFDSVPVNEAFPTTSTVQYVGKGINLFDLGYKHSGKFNVLKSILRTGYLWDRVRVRGGAYGSSLSLDTITGDFALVSYRDPNLTETLEVYDEISDFLENLSLPDEEFEKIIIGCMGQLDPPLTADRKGSVSMAEHLTGVTHEYKQQRRDELLSTTLNDIKSYAGIFQQVKEKGNICVLGNEEKISKAKDIFDSAVKVFA
ncbi:MAG: insulinase family protein [Nitrospinales bacterium]